MLRLFVLAALVAADAAAAPVSEARRAARAVGDVFLASAGNACPTGFRKVKNRQECKQIGKTHSQTSYQGKETEASWPAGCYHCTNVKDCTDGTWWNAHKKGSANGGAQPWCVSTSTAPPPPPPASPPPAPPSEIQGSILFVGDSDIEGWETADAFANSKNVGVGGWTCKNVLKKIDGFLAAHAPDWVVLVCGENDLGAGTSPKLAASRYAKVVEKIAAAGARVVYMGTKPEPSTKKLHAKYREYDALNFALAANLASSAAGLNAVPPLVTVDVYKGFEAVGNGLELYENDRLHLDPPGYALWTAWAQAAMHRTESGTCYKWLSNTCAAASSNDAGGGGSNPTPAPPTPTPAPPPPTADADDDDDDDDESEACSYTLSANGRCNGDGEVVADVDACLDAADTLGLAPKGQLRTFTNKKRPPGCYFHKKRLWFNKHANGKPTNSRSRKSLCEVC